jgi:hypothetical protein
MERVSASLTKDGVLMINILSPVTGSNRELFHSMVKTCREVFPVVKAFKPRKNTPVERVQNIMLVCTMNNPGYLAPKVSPEIQEMLDQEIDLSNIGREEGIVLLDNFAPVEHYAEKMLSSYFQK